MINMKSTRHRKSVMVYSLIHLLLTYFKGAPEGGDIFCFRREPGQHDFSKPIRVNSQPHTAMAIGTIRGAQLAVGKNSRVHVVWDGMGEGGSTLGSTPPHQAHSHDASAHSHPEHDASADSRPSHDDSGNKQPLFYTRLNDEGTAFEPERNIITYAYGLDGGSSVAADPQGHVYITWHAAQPGNTNGEGGRAVFVARSTDEGKTFQRETPAISKPTGACACCGMRAFADSHGDVLALYRTAYQMTNRDETLLISRKPAKSRPRFHRRHKPSIPLPSAMPAAKCSSLGPKVPVGQRAALSRGRFMTGRATPSLPKGAPKASNLGAWRRRSPNPTAALQSFIDSVSPYSSR